MFWDVARGHHANTAILTHQTADALTYATLGSGWATGVWPAALTLARVRYWNKKKKRFISLRRKLFYMSLKCVQILLKTWTTRDGQVLFEHNTEPLLRTIVNLRSKICKCVLKREVLQQNLTCALHACAVLATVDVIAGFWSGRAAVSSFPATRAETTVWSVHEKYKTLKCSFYQNLLDVLEATSPWPLLSTDVHRL